MGNRKKHISRKQRLASLAARRRKEEKLKLAIKEHNQKAKKSRILELIECAYNNSAPTKKGNYYSALNQNFKKLKNKGSGKNTLYRDLLFRLYEKKCFKLIHSTDHLKTLANIVAWNHMMIRDIMQWEPKSYSPENQLVELMQFAFARYKMPKCMYQVWANGIQKQCYWYIMLGLGHNARKLPNLPLTFTKKMASYFMIANANFSIDQAMRWSQVMALSNGNRVLADYFANSYLGRNSFEHEDFWLKFIHLCINDNTLNHKEIFGLVDYLRNQKQEHEHFSLKGRTIDSITKRSAEWHREQARLSGRGGRFVWQSRELNGLTIAKANQGYQIVELLSTKELAKEGRRMNHCVASYARNCYFKHTGIFSLRKQDEFEENKILATIEVDFKSRAIVQAKAKYNRSIEKETYEKMQEWAELNELTISKYL